MKIISLICIAAILTVAVIPVEAISSEDVRTELEIAFLETHRAEQNGGNVTKVAWELNTVAKLLDAGGEENITLASNMIAEVRSSIPSLVIEANQYSSRRSMFTVGFLIVLVVVGVLVWVYGSKFYWGLWLRARGNWKVERS